MKKTLTMLLLALVLCLGLAITVNAAEIVDSGAWKSEKTGKWYDVEGEGQWRLNSKGTLTIFGTGVTL